MREQIRTYLQHPWMRTVVSLLAVISILAGAAMVGAVPQTADASDVMNVVKNGSFEGGFYSQPGCGMVGNEWSCFTNGGAAEYGFYDDMWEPVVADGKHSQLLEINTKGMVVADADRYSGIYQTVRVKPGEVYKLSLAGMIRTTNFEGDPWRYRVEVGYTDGPKADWKQVKNWQDVGWDDYYPRTEPGAFSGFMGQIKAKEGALTLYIRVWKKWGVPYEELDVNLDAISLVGMVDPMGKPMPMPMQGEMMPESGHPMQPMGGSMDEMKMGSMPQSCGGPSLLYNGSFEKGFNPASIGYVGKGWGSYTNGGAASYGFYDDMWPPVVADGKHAQLIEINTKGIMPADGDRYAGIYQRVGKLEVGKTYELTVRGVLRGSGGEAGDPNRWEAQVGYNWGGDTNWQHVSNWEGMDLGGIQSRTEPTSIGTYKVRFTAHEPSMVLFLQGWFKWGETNLEMDLNYDELSLRACESTEMKPEHPGGGMKPMPPMQPEHPIANMCEHVVKPGDMLSAIAEQYGTTVAALMKANNISNPNIIYVGQKLVIPGCEMGMRPTPYMAEGMMSQGMNQGMNMGNEMSQGGMPHEQMPQQGMPQSGMPMQGTMGMMAPMQNPPMQEMMHRVAAGETLNGISLRYGVDPYEVAMMNGITNANFVYVGQQLRMP